MAEAKRLVEDFKYVHARHTDERIKHMPQAIVFYSLATQSYVLATAYNAVALDAGTIRKLRVLAQDETLACFDVRPSKSTKTPKPK